MKAYYNEINPHAAQWLRNLIAAGLIADGDVDERDIRDVRADDLVGYTQCHFFAGTGGWSYALRLAGWPDDRPVWTGSCPCQPFSAAGRKKGMQDERHLWPVWFNLISECRPFTVFGEQVEAAIEHGWLDLVQDDLENEGYAVGAIGLPAACVGAPHIRQRLWFVADTNDTGLERRCGIEHTNQGAVGKNCMACRMAHSEITGCNERRTSEARNGGNSTREQSERLLPARGMGDATCERRCETRQCVAGQKKRAAGSSVETWNAGQSAWSGADWIYCRDQRWRPIESGIVPLAHGISGRVGALQAYGNAIVPQVAAEVIRAYMDCK